MKIGDKVRIKSYEEIYSGQTEEISYGFYTGSFFFDFAMKRFCGGTEKIQRVTKKNYGNIYGLENGWWWLDTWLIPEDFFLDEDFDI